MFNDIILKMGEVFRMQIYTSPMSRECKQVYALIISWPRSKKDDSEKP